MDTTANSKPDTPCHKVKMYIQNIMEYNRELHAAPKKHQSRIPIPAVKLTRSVSVREGNFVKTKIDVQDRLKKNPVPKRVIPRDEVILPAKIPAGIHNVANFRGDEYHIPATVENFGNQLHSMESVGLRSDAKVKHIKRAGTFKEKVGVANKPPIYNQLKSLTHSRTAKPDAPLLSEKSLILLEKKINRIVDTFPTIQLRQSAGANYTSYWNWHRTVNILVQKVISQDGAIDSEKFHNLVELFEHVRDAKSLMDKITLTLGYGFDVSNPIDPNIEEIFREMEVIAPVGKRGRNIVSTSMLPYLKVILDVELKKQSKYDWSVTPISPADLGNRNKIVAWILRVSLIINYPAETVHLAVYIVDKYLSKRNGGQKKLKYNSWSNPPPLLLGITALHIAGKMEEPKAVHVKELIRISGKINYIIQSEVYNLEKLILETIEFDLCPPLSHFFATVVILGRTLEFPSMNMRKLTLDLSLGILYKSLSEYQLSFVPPADKAKVAIEVAIEFIYHNYNISSRRDMTCYKIGKLPGMALGEFALGTCTEVFQQRFKGSKTIDPIASSNSGHQTSGNINVKAN